MMPLVLIVCALLVGTFSGGVVGLLLGRWTGRAKGTVPERVVLDPALVEEIEMASAAWAKSQGRPEAAAGLVADKLRLAHRLNQRRTNRRTRWGWFS
jgi:hypothetical protein